MDTKFKVGDKVRFGRKNGEKTAGTVLKINAKALKIRQDEARGVHKVGTTWRVQPCLVYPMAETITPQENTELANELRKLINKFGYSTISDTLRKLFVF